MAGVPSIRGDVSRGEGRKGVRLEEYPERPFILLFNSLRVLLWLNTL